MRKHLQAFSFLGVPTAILAAFFLAPMFVMLFIALHYGVLSAAKPAGRSRTSRPSSKTRSTATSR